MWLVIGFAAGMARIEFQHCQQECAESWAKGWHRACPGIMDEVKVIFVPKPKYPQDDEDDSTHGG